MTRRWATFKAHQQKQKALPGFRDEFFYEERQRSFVILIWPFWVFLDRISPWVPLALAAMRPCICCTPLQILLCPGQVQETWLLFREKTKENEGWAINFWSTHYPLPSPHLNKLYPWSKFSCCGPPSPTKQFRRLSRLFLCKQHCFGLGRGKGNCCNLVPRAFGGEKPWERSWYCCAFVVVVEMDNTFTCVWDRNSVE